MRDGRRCGSKRSLHCFIQSLSKYRWSAFCGQACLCTGQAAVTEANGPPSWIFIVVERGRFETNEQVHIMCWVGMGVRGKNWRAGGYGVLAGCYFILGNPGRPN